MKNLSIFFIGFCVGMFVFTCIFGALDIWRSSRTGEKTVHETYFSVGK